MYRPFMVDLGAQPSSPPEPPEPAPVAPEFDVPAAWLRLALHAGEPDFCERLLALLLEQAGASGGGVWLLARTAHGQGVHLKAARDIPNSDPAWSRWLGERLRELMARRKAMSVLANPGEIAGWEPAGPCLFVPLVWEGAGCGVALLNDARVTIAAAGRLGVLAGWALRLSVRAPRAGVPGQDCTDALLASAHSAEWPAVLAAHLRRQSGAWRASLLREAKDRWQAVAVSGAGEVKRRTAESRAIEQEFARLAASGANAHELVHRERAAVSIRFGKASGWGALLEFEKGHTPDEKQVVRGLAGLIQVGERVLPQVPAPGLRLAFARRLLARSSTASPRGSRWVLAGLTALLVLAACLPVTESFEGDCELQPAQRFTVVAEVEGRVQNIAVEEGAIVTTGQTLATLDVSTLQTRLEVVRELKQEQDAEARRQQGLQDMTGYRLAKLRADQYAHEETSLLEDLRHAIIVAPIDGKILSKDLPQKQGTVLRLGDTLCEVGGLDAWNLQIALPEEDLDAFLRALTAGGKLPVTYRLKAGSTIVLSAEIASVRQVSEMAYPVEGKNVVYLTVPGVKIPEELRRDLRPGFSGRAKVAGRVRAWGVILSRRAVQYLRLHWGL
jgi:multidrug efflux pump subunit AcrA (membrane-fusion protein)